MFSFFIDPKQLIKQDTPHCLILARPHLFKIWGGLSLILAMVAMGATVWVGFNLVGLAVVVLYLGLGVWLISSRSSITFDLSRRVVYFSTHHLLLERRTRVVSFAEIAAVYLDFEEQIYHSLRTIYTPQERVRRKWFIFLVLTNKQTATVARHWASYPLDQAPVLSKQTVEWEALATKICAVTGKLLVRTPSVPGRAPHTFVDVVNQIVQRQLESLPPGNELAGRTIRLRSHPNGSLEIIVDGANYRRLDELDDPAVRNIIQDAVDEWQSFAASPVSTLLKMKEIINLSRSEESS